MSNKNSQSGFTLIELLIVVLIIGILASIAIPVFNGQRTKAKNSVAQSTVRNAFSAASSARLSNDDKYDGLTNAMITNEESTVKTGNIVNPGTNADDKTISVTGGAAASTAVATNATADSAGITICASSKGDKSYCVRQTQSSTGVAGSPTYGSGSSPAVAVTDTTTGLAANLSAWK